MLERQDFRDEIERRAGRWLPDPTVEALLMETEAHLDASIQARLELGDSCEVAEREAVAAFGTPRKIVGRLIEIHRARFQGFFLGCTTATALGCAFAVLASPVLGGLFVTMTWAVFSVTFGCFVEASKHRRPWWPVFVATLAFWLAFSAICASWLRSFSVEGWLNPRQDGPLDPFHAAQWAAVATAVFFGYLVLAYRMARPGSARRKA